MIDEEAKRKKALRHYRIKATDEDEILEQLCSALKIPTYDDFKKLFAPSYYCMDGDLERFLKSSDDRRNEALAEILIKFYYKVEELNPYMYYVIPHMEDDLDLQNEVMEYVDTITSGYIDRIETEYKNDNAKVYTFADFGLNPQCNCLKNKEETTVKNGLDYAYKAIKPNSIIFVIDGYRNTKIVTINKDTGKAQETHLFITRHYIDVDRTIRETDDLNILGWWMMEMTHLYDMDYYGVIIQKPDKSFQVLIDTETDELI